MNPYRIVAGTVLLLATTAGSMQAQGALRAAPSGRATSEVVLSVPRPAGTTMAMPAAPSGKPMVIRLDYGQPHLRGRAVNTDSLVPLDKPWRTGANSSTILTTDVDLVIGGASIPKGSYVLYTIPGRSAWKLIIQRNVGQQVMQYSDSNDAGRIDLRHTTLPSPVESFTMWLIPSTEPGPARGELRFAWGTAHLSTDWSVK